MEGKMETKLCIKCVEEKPTTTEYFGRLSDGLNSVCKLCKHAYLKSYHQKNREKIKATRKAYYEANKDRINAKNKAHRKENPEHFRAIEKAWRDANKEKVAASSKAHYEANKEKRSLYSKAHYEKNKEKVLARCKANYEANREARLAQQKAFRAANREKIAESNKAYVRTPQGKYTSIKSAAKYRKLLFELDYDYYENKLWGKPCHYCGCEIEITGLDRKDNDKGYTNDNVVPCCIYCNNSKHITPYEEYMSTLTEERRSDLRAQQNKNKKTTDIERQDGYAYVSQ